MALAPIRELLAPAIEAQPERVKLSIVIPCYNEERTLEGCVDSVLAIQSESLELELIIVDDCSTDRSLAVARRLAERVPGMILRHQDKNTGKGAALSTGIASATGDLVALEQSDGDID